METSTEEAAWPRMKPLALEPTGFRCGRSRDGGCHRVKFEHPHQRRDRQIVLVPDPRAFLAEGRCSREDLERQEGRNYGHAVPRLRPPTTRTRALLVLDRDTHLYDSRLIDAANADVLEHRQRPVELNPDPAIVDAELVREGGRSRAVEALTIV